MKKILYIMFSLFVLIGCKEEEKHLPTAIEDLNSTSTPLAIVQKDSIAIPVFDFENFEPLLHKDNDSIYIINLWATWCKPCVKELPDIEKIQEEFRDKKVEVILTSLDFPENIENELIPFVQKMNLQSKVIVLDEPDANAWIPKVDASWSGAIPATLIYSKHERIFINKSLTHEELKNIIDQLLTFKN